MAKNDQVTISDYYKSLSRAEKEFNPRDAVVINQVIEQGLWRQDK